MIERTFQQAGLSVVFALAAMMHTPARAQPCQIEPAISSAMTLSADQAAAVTACAQQNAADLSSEDADKRRIARRAILAPLEGANVSAAFRIQYAKSLEPALRELAKHADDRLAVVALIIAGDLATETSTGMLTGQLASPRPALRYEAAFGLRRTFEAASVARPAVLSTTVSAAMTALQNAMGVEQDGQVLKAQAAALLAGAGLPERDFPSARLEASSALCVGLSNHVKARGTKLPDQSSLEAYHKGVRGVRDIFLQPDARMNAASANAAAELSGRLIALAARALKAKDYQAASESSRGEMTSAVGASETLIQLAGNVLSPGTRFPTPGLGTTLRESTVASEAKFILDATSIVGADGVLTKPPFQFSKAHFLP
ncbi:MAG: hypothetical protein HBSAPP03_21730 [Phycisphaerae bacterium]|nr:MAG: hypothetical protein HBSAPP03_21730 [Phycisphaerae bacterium]